LQQIISSFEDKERFVAAENKVNTLQTFVNMQQQQVSEDLTVQHSIFFFFFLWSGIKDKCAPKTTQR